MKLCLQFVNMDQMIVNYWFPHELGIKDSTSSTVTPLDTSLLTSEKLLNCQIISNRCEEQSTFLN